MLFPCNQFMKQESDANLEIKKWILTRYPTNFMIFEKIDVNGKKASEVFEWLRYNSSKKDDKGLCKKISWNFEKFLVDKNGNVFQNYGTGEIPIECEADIIEQLELKDADLNTPKIDKPTFSSESDLKQNLIEAAYNICKN